MEMYLWWMVFTTRGREFQGGASFGTQRILFRRGMQAEATQDPTRPVRRVYAAEVAIIQGQGGGDRSQIPSFESVKSAIKRT